MSDRDCQNNSKTLANAMSESNPNRPGHTENPSSVEKLIFQEQPPGPAEYFRHQFDDYSLEARITYDQDGNWPSVLSIHGARSDYTKNNNVTFELQERGISILAPALSGHNEISSIHLSQTSLARNIEESKAFYDYLQPDRPRAVIGYSMGATSALEILKEHLGEIDRIVLFYPAIYPRAAYDQPFGELFRNAIRKPSAYFENDLLDSLVDFRGKLLLIKGEYDGLKGQQPGVSAGEVEINGQKYYSPIPKDIMDLLSSPDTFPCSEHQFIEVPKCGHSVATWIGANPQGGRQLLDILGNFLNS